jgi:ABC-type phosphate transport system substrate-binding protein
MAQGPRHRTRSRLTAAALGVLCVLASLTPLTAQGSGVEGDVAVVVNTDVPIDNLTLGDLRRLVLGDKAFWPGSVRVTLLIRAPIAHERDVILKVVCQMTEAQFRQHWIARVFRADSAVAPKIVYSAQSAAELTAQTPGAITFIDASQVSKNMKVVKIDGKLPGENGYLLR